MNNACREESIRKNRLVCYFNIVDICIQYHKADIGINRKEAVKALNDKYIIDEGTYEIPEDICPLGRTAEQLMPYATKEVHDA